MAYEQSQLDGGGSGKTSISTSNGANDIKKAKFQTTPIGIIGIGHTAVWNGFHDTSDFPNNNKCVLNTTAASAASKYTVLASSVFDFDIWIYLDSDNNGPIDNIWIYFKLEFGGNRTYYFVFDAVQGSGIPWVWDKQIFYHFYDSTSTWDINKTVDPKNSINNNAVKLICRINGSPTNIPFRLDVLFRKMKGADEITAQSNIVNENCPFIENNLSSYTNNYPKLSYYVSGTSKTNADRVKIKVNATSFN